MITCIKWSPIYGNVLASSSCDQTIAVWDTKTGKKLAEFRHNRRIVTFAWNQHVNSIVFVDENGKSFLWDIPAWPKLDGANANGKINEKHGTVRLITYKASTTNKIPANSHVCNVAWNMEHSNCIALGHDCGRVIVKKIGRSESILFNKNRRSARGSVAILQWDTRSILYLLVGYVGGSIVLWDTEQCVEAQIYNTGSTIQAKRGNAGLLALQWVHGQVGNFISVENNTCKVKLWNVSQSEPLGSHFVRSETKNSSRHLSRTCPLIGKGYDQKTLCAFSDGSVGIYNLKTHRLEYESFEGHRETIFGMTYNPLKKNLLATSSYDGFIKLWHSPTMTLQNSFRFESSVYDISFSPCGSFLACVTQNGLVAICNASLDSNGVISGNDNHKYQSSFASKTSEDSILASFSADCVMYKCDWNKEDETLIVATGESKFAFVINEKGLLVGKFRHPDNCFGCQWKVGDRSLFVTGCYDGIVRIFDSRFVENPCLLQLNGHVDRVFNVAFSPLINNVIASGSNDQTIRVWQIHRINHNENAQPDLTGNCKCILKGHSDNIRALTWCSELPFILYSGSWDATIRVWNVDTEECMSVLKGHQADVYRIASHSERPFRFISSSRDTTMRVWSMYGGLKWKVISNFFNATNSYKTRERNGSLTDSTVQRPYLCSEVFKRIFRHFPCVEADSSSTSAPSYIYDYNLKQWIKIFQFVESAEGVDEFLHILVRKAGLSKSTGDLNHRGGGVQIRTLMGCKV
eukprot:g1147.t1